MKSVFLNIRNETFLTPKRYRLGYRLGRVFRNGVESSALWTVHHPKFRVNKQDACRTRVTTNSVNMTYARHESPSSSVVRASDWCTEGHGVDSRRGLRFVLCPTLATCWILHLFISRYLLPISSPPPSHPLRRALFDHWHGWHYLQGFCSRYTECVLH